MFGFHRFFDFTPEEWENLLRELRAIRARRLNSAGDGEGRINTVTDEEVNSNNAALLSTEEKEEASQLKPEKVDYQVPLNAKSHHTDEYDENAYGLVVRRGQEFELQVTFDRAYDVKLDQLILQLTFGSRPQESKNTLIRIKESKELSNSSWSMRIDRTSGNSVILTVMSPANALVGEYKVFVETKTKKSGAENEYLTFKRKPDKDDTVIVLFNAWCQEDPVYMSDEKDRQEYVLNPRGCIWVGNEYYSRAQPWNFGQFEDVSMRTCLFILDKCQSLANSSRGDPVMVSRFLTKMVNSSDEDGGILVGRWSGNYAPHTSPLDWAGSVRILEEYSKLKNKNEGVKYGQCWVFSGLVTTLGRAIGIPTRSITNFSSAHDTDASTTIDDHYSEETNEPLSHMNADSVWNFHVWNEIFCTRPDLPPQEYDGWQAIDATPQEQSQGSFCCGPSPVKAIKAGIVYIPYDTRFVFGEVNGDRVSWHVDRWGEMKAKSIDKFAVGKKISTKAVGSDHRNDVTDYYKHNEGSPAERAAVCRAYRMSSRRDNEIYKTRQPKDVVFDFLPPDSDLTVGNDFDVKLKMKNTSDSVRTIKVTIVTKAAYYTGITAMSLDKLQETYKLQPEKENVVSLAVPASQYVGKTPAETNVKAFLTARVEETEQVFHDVEVINLQKPEMVFEFKKDEVMEKQKFDMTIYFTNPLKVQLDNCVFNIETARYVSPDTIKEMLKKPVQPQERASITVTLEPKRRGFRYVDARFTSDQLSGVEGRVDFVVQP